MITVIWYANEIDYISHSYSTNYHCVKVLLRMRLRPNNNNKQCVDDHWFQSRGTRNYLQKKRRMYGCQNCLQFNFLPARASELGNVIGLVSVYILNIQPFRVEYRHILYPR